MVDGASRDVRRIPGRGRLGLIMFAAKDPDAVTVADAGDRHTSDPPVTVGPVGATVSISQLKLAVAVTL